MIPFGDKVADYFRKYQGAQSHLDAILHSLRNGQDVKLIDPERAKALSQRTSELLRDNSASTQKQAASATVGLPQLQAAFANIYQTMDLIVRR